MCMGDQAETTVAKLFERAEAGRTVRVFCRDRGMIGYTASGADGAGMGISVTEEGGGIEGTEGPYYTPVRLSPLILPRLSFCYSEKEEEVCGRCKMTPNVYTNRLKFMNKCMDAFTYLFVTHLDAGDLYAQM